MANLFEYAEKFGKLKFGELGLTEADNAVFCRLAYYDFLNLPGTRSVKRLRKPKYQMKMRKTKKALPT